ncbi:MAG: hypothetical protein H7288_02815 [Kineosporiaceae bacterium]|nr:hypothetical protein [Aeromicrobium sp.]
MAVLNRVVQDRAEDDVNLVDAVGRQRLPLSNMIGPAVLLQVAVVAGDPSGGDFVEPHVTELRCDVGSGSAPSAKLWRRVAIPREKFLRLFDPDVE